MAGHRRPWLLIILLFLSVVLTIAVIPGVGLETRNIGDFPSWQQTLFTDGGPIVLLLNLLAIGLAFWSAKAGAGLGMLVGLAVLAFSIVGLTGFGAPAVPSRLMDVEILHILDALGILVAGAAVLGRPPTPRASNLVPPT